MCCRNFCIFTQLQKYEMQVKIYIFFKWVSFRNLISIIIMINNNKKKCTIKIFKRKLYKLEKKNPQNFAQLLQYYISPKQRENKNKQQTHLDPLKCDQNSSPTSIIRICQQPTCKFRSSQSMPRHVFKSIENDKTNPMIPGQ